MTTVDRRSFLKAGSAGLLASVGLQALSTRMAHAAPGTGARDAGADYGPLTPTFAVNTRRKWLALPDGFEYSIIGMTGSEMTDGRSAPRSSDGMGAFAGPGGTTTLIRNQEIRFNTPPTTPPAPGAPPFRFTQGDYVIEATDDAYDRTAGGGTTTLRFDPAGFRTRRGGLVEHFVSLTGTVVNCAGGVALGGAGWLTCEEIVVNAATPRADDGTEPRTEQRHGYAYLTPLVGPTPGDPATSRPLTAMGRFSHEAAAVDERNGTVYLTEDAGSGRGSGFYRFVPTDPADLAKGGVLQVLGLLNRPSADLRQGQTEGAPLAVTWITVADPDPDAEEPNAVFAAGFAAGAAMFNRLEGCWRGSESIFFSSTSGGDAKNGDLNTDGFREGYGQIWEYLPVGRTGGKLVLLYESPDGDVLDSPDNIVISPRGGLVICEDDSSDGNVGQQDTSPFFGEDKNRLIGLTLQGTAFPFAENVFSDSELAGACWSADGTFLFVNMFGVDEEETGGTMAITGPWERGAL